MFCIWFALVWFYFICSTGDWFQDFVQVRGVSTTQLYAQPQFSVSISISSFALLFVVPLNIAGVSVSIYSKLFHFRLHCDSLSTGCCYLQKYRARYPSKLSLSMALKNFFFSLPYLYLSLLSLSYSRSWVSQSPVFSGKNNPARSHKESLLLLFSHRLNHITGVCINLLHCKIMKQHIHVW